MANPNIIIEPKMSKYEVSRVIGGEVLRIHVDFDRSASSHLTPPMHDKGTIFGTVRTPLTSEEIADLTSID